MPRRIKRKSGGHVQFEGAIGVDVREQERRQAPPVGGS